MDKSKDIERAKRLEVNNQMRGRTGGKGKDLMLNQKVKSNPRRGGGINRPLAGKGAVG